MHYQSVCSLDCPDVCSLVVEKTNGKIMKIGGNPHHPLTQGFICSKGRKLAERIYHPDRITSPMLKENGRWKKLSWDNALDIICERLSKIKDEYGTQAIYHNYESGSGGILNNLDRRFFNALGGVSLPSGSLCWGAGYTAQEYDFGALYSHEWADLQNSKTIIIWGRDPVTTNLHILPFIKRAKESGAKIIVINPIKTRTAELADHHIALRPGSDGALALGMAYCILENNWADLEFIKEHVFGFREYVKLVKEYNLATVSKITGIAEDDIKEISRIYAKVKPSSILLGYGMQRYSNSGKTVRAIDALAAITGNIGVAGGGVNYAHQYWKGIFKDIKGKELGEKSRYFKRPILAEEISKASNPPIKAVFVTRSNPVTQLANTSKVLEVFKEIEFKVVVDFFLTDTAEIADIVLPCTTIFEEENIVISSWNNYIHYAPKIIEPVGEAKSDAEIFGLLAKKLSLAEFPLRTSEEWLDDFLKPAFNTGITLENLKKKGFMRNPLAPEISWQNYKFETPSGKYELFSQKALAEGKDPLPSYEEPKESILGNPELAKEYPLHLLTSHAKDFMHSQFYNLMEPEDGDTLPAVEIHPETASNRYIKEKDTVILESPRGQIKGIAILNPNLRRDVCQVLQGWWLKEGGGINLLTPDLESDFGIGTSYYDCLCQVRKFLD